MNYDSYGRKKSLLSWQTRNNIKTGVIVLGLVAIAAAVIAGIGYMIWFFMNYDCVASHTETRQQCDTTYYRDSKGNAISSSTTCYPYEVTVCDRWVKKER